MAADYDYLPASDGTGDASLMHVTATRLIGGTTLTVDTVAGVPAKFIGTTGNLLSTGFIDPATKIDFKGHIDTGHIVIDGFEPGSADAGNTIGQVVVVKPNTGWANRVANFIKNATGYGTPEDHIVANLTVDNDTTLDGPVGGAGYSMATMANPYKFSASLNANQTIPVSTWTKVNLNAEQFDTGSNFDDATNYQFTAQIGRAHV